MLEPDDPGGTSLQVSNEITITCSGMDTEGSFHDTDCSETSNATIKRKRSSTNKSKCKSCKGKKRKHHKMAAENVSTCICENTSDSSYKQAEDSQNNFVTPLPVSLVSNDESPTTHPSLGRKSYQASDVAPFVVHVQRESVSQDKNLFIHPITFGQFLKKNHFKSIINGSVKKIGRNRISLSFSKLEDANLFLESGILSSYKYKAFVPIFNVTRMGVIRGVPANWSDEEVLDNISVPMGCGKVIRVRRLKKKTIVDGNSTFTPIETVVLTFDGQVLPKRIFLCYNSLPVDLYIYPTIQCFNCCRYGHIKGQCRSAPKCFKCGAEHSGDNCSSEDELCFVCSGHHMATSRKCPEFSRQRAIKETMAKSCVSYGEALKLHPPVSKSYADVLQSPPPSSSMSNKFAYSTDKNTTSNNFKNNNSSSYKKTVYIKRNTPHNLNKGYDKEAHAALIKGYNVPLEHSEPVINSMQFSDVSTRDLIITLINSLTQSNILSVPSNVASNSEISINSELNNGPVVLNSSMELPQYHK